MVSTEKLSNQDLWQFREHAGIVNNRHPLWADYEAALTRFPSTQSCLLLTARKQNRWNLAEFDWSSMSNHHDIEVCLFRIADTLGEPEKMEEWFAVQGYETVAPLKLITDGRDRLETDGWVGLYPCLDSKVFEKRISFNANPLREIIGRLLPLGAPRQRDHCMILEYSKSGKITAIQSLRRGG